MATAPMNLGTVMLGEASRSQKRRILCDSAEMRSAEQMRRDRRGKGGCGEKRGRGVGVGRGPSVSPGRGESSVVAWWQRVPCSVNLFNATELP